VRGSVAAQVDGAIRAWSTAHDNVIAVVCPAFPDLGRTVVDGVVLVDGCRSATLQPGSIQ
jgi:D-threonate/D-erythronate kinase